VNEVHHGRYRHAQQNVRSKELIPSEAERVRNASLDRAGPCLGAKRRCRGKILWWSIAYSTAASKKCYGCRAAVGATENAWLISTVFRSLL